MNSAFYDMGYNASSWDIGDLSGWDVGNVTEMQFMFSYTGYMKVK